MSRARGKYQPKQKRTDEKKRRILDAALDLFGILGFHDTTAKAIAARAGVATGSLYRYFRDKKVAFLAVCGRMERELGGDIPLRQPAATAGASGTGGNHGDDPVCRRRSPAPPEFSPGSLGHEDSGSWQGRLDLRAGATHAGHVHGMVSGTKLNKSEKKNGMFGIFMMNNEDTAGPPALAA